MVSCRIDAKTFEVSHESHGKDLKNIEEDLNNQRFGKESVPDYPGKTEKPPTFGELFEDKEPTISFAMGKEEKEE